MQNLVLQLYTFDYIVKCVLLVMNTVSVEKDERVAKVLTLKGVVRLLAVFKLLQRVSCTHAVPR